MNWKTWLVQVLFGAVMALLKMALARLEEKDTINDVLKYADLRVKALMDKELDNEDKRKMAAEEVKNDLKEIGKECKDGIINMVVEIVYNAAKYATGKK